MTTPYLCIDLDKIEHNARTIAALCQPRGVRSSVQAGDQQGGHAVHIVRQVARGTEYPGLGGCHGGIIQVLFGRLERPCLVFVKRL